MNQTEEIQRSLIKQSILIAFSHITFTFLWFYLSINLEDFIIGSAFTLFASTFGATINLIIHIRKLNKLSK